MPNYRRVFIKNTYVFITIITYNRKPLLVENIECLKESLLKTKEKFEFEIYAMVVLPEHIHFLLKPKSIEEYPKIISSFKYNFSKHFNKNCAELSQSKIDKREKGIWHRRYYEHTIRDENDLYNHLNYIHYNPVKHKLVKNVKDWKYSSFAKFVKKEYYDINWGTFEDIQEIEKMDLG